MDVFLTLTLGATQHTIDSSTIFAATGIMFCALLGIRVLMYLLIYRRARVDEALIRSGMGEIKVAVGGGFFVWPVVQTVKRIRLTQFALTFSFQGDLALRWQGGERFDGQIVATMQIPADVPGLIMAAARAFDRTDDPGLIAQSIDGVVRSTCRDVLRTIRRITFDIEPGAVEVRLTRALDLAAAAFGFRVRAVHIHPGVMDTGRLRRTLAKLDDVITSGDGEAGSTRNHRVVGADPSTSIADSTPPPKSQSDDLSASAS